MAKPKLQIDKFFKYARERHSIYLKRAAGAPREEWTKDPIFQEWRFTNVFRELDATTVWFRQHVRDPLRKKPEVLLATVMFRLLNRIKTGEAIFSQITLDGGTAFEQFLQSGDIREVKRAIKAYCGRGPYVTGAYIISSPAGMPKLDGMMKILSDFNKKSGWREKAEELPKETGSLEQTWSWLKDQPFFGPFHSYEIVTDLRFTSLLDSAPDIMTWCNIGPGARRGINRVMGRDKRDHSISTEQMLTEMRDLLKCSRSELYWPERWTRWEMRDVEHTLCEFDKYQRIANNELTKKGKPATPRGRFR